MLNKIMLGGDMSSQVVVGGATSSVNLIIHALLMALVVKIIVDIRAHESIMPPLLRRTIVIVLTGFLLVAGHFVEVLIWAYTYQIVGAAPPDTPLVYFAFVNYTTLGYGDVLPVGEWRLVAPLTALNGIMLIGWSTALIFEVLRQTAAADAKTSVD